MTISRNAFPRRQVWSPGRTAPAQRINLHQLTDIERELATVLERGRPDANKIPATVRYLRAAAANVAFIMGDLQVGLAGAKGVSRRPGDEEELERISPLQGRRRSQ